MRKLWLATGTLAVGLLVPTVPASAHLITCAKEKPYMDARGRGYLLYLKRQHQAATKGFDQAYPPRYEGTVGTCRPGLIYRVRGVAHRHTFTAPFRVNEIGGFGHDVGEGSNAVRTTVLYTIKSTWTATLKPPRFVRLVLRPGGKVAVGGGDDWSPVIFPDIDPLTP